MENAYWAKEWMEQLNSGLFNKVYDMIECNYLFYAFYISIILIESN